MEMRKKMAMAQSAAKKAGGAQAAVEGEETK
jgi:hypothetical protein